MGKLKTLTIGFAILLTSLLILSACGQSAAGGAGVKATWIKPTIAGDTVSLPVSEVEKDIMTHFKISSPATEMAFMAYKLDGTLYARANICPPCLSEGFTLDKNTLVCDTCSTVFNAKTGAGIKGACIAYPKAPVSYEVKDGNIIMTGADLVTAFQNTIKPKK